MSNASASSLRYQRRKRADVRFRLYGIGAIGLALLILVFLLGSILLQGLDGLREAQLRVTVDLSGINAKALDETALRQLDYQRLLRQSILADAPEAETLQQKRALYALVSIGAPYQLRDEVLAYFPDIPASVTLYVSAADAVDMFTKGKLQGDSLTQKLSPFQQRIIAYWQDAGALALHFDSGFFAGGDSREPEMAGFMASVVGSLFTILICLLLAFPLGVATAVYLEEFAPKNWISDVIEVNINNLAAVPSIVFGLLGLALYLSFFGMPRSSALAGGLTLALLVLPVMIIATRAALRAVPSSIRDAARGLGASEVQVVAHHVLPLALPGIMTGTILAVARAMGETAPLLMIGMVAFIADIPALVTDPATAMPVQIYLWASSPEASFADKTSAGILVLLVILLTLNLLAIFIRNKFETKW